MPPEQLSQPAALSYRRAAVRLASIYPGWWVATAVLLVSFAQVAFFNPVLGIFFDPLQEEFGWSRTTIAGALSVGTVAGALAAVFLGPVIDRHGGRWFMSLGCLVMGICLIFLSQIHHVWEYYLLYAIGRALTIAVVGAAIGVTVPNWFIRKRARATGLTLVGVRGGMAAMPLIVLLFISLFDWRTAWLALGIIVLTLGVLPSWKFIRRRPEDLGLHPDGLPPTPAADAGPVTSVDLDPRWTVREAMRTRAFWLLLFGTSQIFFVGGAVNLTTVPHLEDNGIGRGTAVTVITVWALMGIVGGVFGGEFGQRLAVRFAMPLSLALSSVGLVWLLLVQNVWMAYLFAVWHGASFGALLPLNQLAFPDYFGRWNVGAIRGVVSPVQYGLNAAGPVLAGLVFDQRGSFDLIYIAFVGCYLLGAVAMLFATQPTRPPHSAPASG